MQACTAILKPASWHAWRSAREHALGDLYELPQARLSIDIGRVQDNSFAIMQSALRILWYESNLAYLAGQLAYILDGHILCAVALT